ncbi:MAG: MBL fold metallo-hydrolase [Chlorobi bacterium]|nr:MBL fold metallo-hydrolase [Chlorobiota bacterium]
MVRICAIASGSNGNCYYIGNNEEAILIDAGISRRKILQRMKMKNLDIRKVKAVFITHEHADHMRGIRVLSDLHSIPAYFTPKTYNRARPTDRPEKVVHFEAGDSIQIGEFTVHSFSKNHDAVDPVSFRVSINGFNIGVLTDIGEPCENVTSHLNKCDAVFLESNYDEDLLWSGPYPQHLKNRVASANGHLSNNQAAELVKNLKSSKLKHIFLSHISAENNKLDFALESFKEIGNTINVMPTSRFEPTLVLELTTTR